MNDLTYERYDSYKDSGIEWIREMPDKWGVNRVEDVSDVIDPQPDHREPALAEGSGHPYIGIRDLNRDGSLNFKTARKVELSAVEKQERSFKVVSGDILFCKVGTLGEPRIIVPNGRFALSATLVLIKTKNKISNVFLKYALESSYIFDQINHFGSGSTRPALGIKQIRKFFFTNPSLSEQKVIANYLDTKTTQIDRKIDLLTQKATKYGELKQSLINETVTHGLDKSVAMKDSGVEWIGEVPEHWEVYRIADIAVQNKVKNSGLIENNLLSLSYGRIIPKDFNTSFGLLPESFETYQVVKAGTVILRLTDLQNDQKSLRVGLVREQGIITSAYLGLCFHGSISSVFAYYLLHVYDLSKVFYWFGGGLRSTMRFDDIKVIPFVLPPHDEQRSIADYLDTKTAHIDRIIETINTQVEKLKELRKTLINDVVTGKIKVYQEGEVK